MTESKEVLKNKTNEKKNKQNHNKHTLMGLCQRYTEANRKHSYGQGWNNLGEVKK